jgi:hypothetical protein
MKPEFRITENLFLKIAIRSLRIDTITINHFSISSKIMNLNHKNVKNLYFIPQCKNIKSRKSS